MRRRLQLLPTPSLSRPTQVTTSLVHSAAAASSQSQCLASHRTSKAASKVFLLAALKRLSCLINLMTKMQSSWSQRCALFCRSKMLVIELLFFYQMTLRSPQILPTRGFYSMETTCQVFQVQLPIVSSELLSRTAKSEFSTRSASLWTLLPTKTGMMEH